MHITTRFRGLALATTLSFAVLCNAGPSEAKMVAVQQSRAEEGMAVPVTYDTDLSIQVPGNRIKKVWNSHGLLFNPRYDEGGNIVLLQATATPQDRQLLPELGRPLGTVTVELEGGKNLIFHLKYTNKSQDVAITVVKPEPPAPPPEAPPAPPMMGKVTQEGFTPPFQGSILPRSEPTPRESSPQGEPTPNPQDNEKLVNNLSSENTDKGKSSAEWWILERGMKNPGIWSSGPDAGGYRAFFQMLKQGKDEGKSFEEALSLSQKISGINEGNLRWLSQTLASVPDPIKEEKPTAETKPSPKPPEETKKQDAVAVEPQSVAPTAVTQTASRVVSPTEPQSQGQSPTQTIDTQQKVEAERLAAQQKAEAERLEAERKEQERLVAQQRERDQIEKEQLEAQNKEKAERLKARLLEAQRMEAQRKAEAEQLESQKKAEAERIEAERRKTEQVAAQRADSQKKADSPTASPARHPVERKGATVAALARYQIPTDGGTISADKLLAVQGRIWYWNRGMYRKQLGDFIAALANSEETDNERAIQDASNRSGLLLNEVRYLVTKADELAKGNTPDSPKKEPKPLSLAPSRGE
jgi:hypothetical protein